MRRRPRPLSEPAAAALVPWPSEREAPSGGARATQARGVRRPESPCSDRALAAAAIVARGAIGTTAGRRRT